MKKRIRLLIFGFVQGVFFRASASGEARKLKLTGFARNLPDGSVEVTAEGEEEPLKAMIAWSRKGPLGARVERLETEWLEATGQFTDFRIC